MRNLTLKIKKVVNARISNGDLQNVTEMKQKVISFGRDECLIIYSKNKQKRKPCNGVYYFLLVGFSVTFSQYVINDYFLLYFLEKIYQGILFF